MDPCVQAYLQSLDLDLAEGEALFQLLQNGTGLDREPEVGGPWPDLITPQAL